MKGYRISIIRHGLTSANENGIYIGSTDMPLSPKGASELAVKMDNFDYPSVQKVYTSPLCRCMETAEILFPEIEILPVDGLRELNLGEFEGKTVDQLVNRDDYKKWLRGGKDTRPPKGESLEKMTARVFSALHNIIMNMMEEGIAHSAIITHGGIITNMLTCFGLPKYDPKYLTAESGEGFDILVTTQMWLNSQAFEILGYCPYEKIEDSENE